MGPVSYTGSLLGVLLETAPEGSEGSKKETLNIDAVSVKMSIDPLGSSGALCGCPRSRQGAESSSYSLNRAQPGQGSLPQRAVPQENSAMSCAPGIRRMSSPALKGALSTAPQCLLTEEKSFKYLKTMVIKTELGCL